MSEKQSAGGYRNAALRTCVLFGFFVILATVCCTRIGHDFPMERINEIEPGKSTQGDVRGIFGEPNHVGLSGDGSGWWGYTFIEATAFGTGKSKSFTVNFDPSGVVTNKYESASKTRPFNAAEVKSKSMAATRPSR